VCRKVGSSSSSSSSSGAWSKRPCLFLSDGFDTECRGPVKSGSGCHLLQEMPLAGRLLQHTAAADICRAAELQSWSGWVCRAAGPVLLGMLQVVACQRMPCTAVCLALAGTHSQASQAPMAGSAAG
jgi:hypothetical protein